MSSVHCALVHHPVRDRDGGVATAAVTNIDVHDIARSCHTFGMKGFYVVTPIEAQRALVGRILEHWQLGAGKRRMPHRSEALAICQVAESIEAAAQAIEAREGRAPRIVATAAKPPEGKGTVSFPEAAAALRAAREPSLILFGTGHGLTHEVLARADLLIEPIYGVAGYNHLSVRAAAAIVLDRLFGAR